MLYIKRDLEKDLKTWYQSKLRKPLLLFGARQVGKTTLIKQFAKKQKLKLIYLNFEDIHTKQALQNINSVNDFLLFLHGKKYITLPTSDLQAQNIGSKTKKHLDNILIFLDEIQEAPNMLSLLRFIKEDLPELATIATGSWLNIFLKESHEKQVMQFPVGRVDMLTLYPITFLEYLHTTNPNLHKLITHAWKTNIQNTITPTIHELLSQEFTKYIATGGMPEATSLLAEYNAVVPEIQQIQGQIINSILQDAKQYNPEYGTEIDLIVSNVFSNPSQRKSLSKLNPNTNYVTTRKLLEYLKSAFIVFNAYATVNTKPPLSIQTKIHPKFFALDIGLSINFMGIFTQLMQASLSNNSIKTAINTDAQGMLAEQYVAQVLLKSLNKQYLPNVPRLFYWTKLKSNAEIDFVFLRENSVLNQNGKYVAVEVKSGKVGTLKSMVSFVQLLIEHDYSLDEYEFIRFWNNSPRIETLKHKITINNKTKNITIKLRSLPIYLAELIV